MDYVEILRMSAAIMGTAMSAGYFSQAYTIFKEKHYTDVSILSYVIFALGTSVWLAYGVAINDLTVIMGFLFGVIGSWLVLVLMIIYRS